MKRYITTIIALSLVGHAQANPAGTELPSSHRVKDQLHESRRQDARGALLI